MDCRGVSISLLNPKFAPFSPDSKTKQTKPKWFNTAAFRADTTFVVNYFLFVHTIRTRSKDNFMLANKFKNKTRLMHLVLAAMDMFGAAALKR